MPNRLLMFKYWIKRDTHFHSDPGGDLPVAMVYLFTDEGPINSLKGLKKNVSFR